MIVMKYAPTKECYAYKMEKIEATSAEIKKGVLEVGMIEVFRYRVPVI